MKIDTSEWYKEVLTYNVAKKLYTYLPEVGEIYANELDPTDQEIAKIFGRGGLANFNAQKAGNKLGTLIEHPKSKTQYYSIRLGFRGRNRLIRLHVLAWFLMCGVWPIEIDHIDGDGANNKFSNLRHTNRTENNKNRKKQRNNTSGVCGVAHKGDGWRAYVYVSDPIRKQINLGRFDNFFDAVCVRKSYESKNGFSERHGR